MTKNDLKDSNENTGGIALALWSGCFSCVKAVSIEKNRGPNMHQRHDIFQVIEKLSSDNPNFGKGVQVGILWKLKNNQSDVDFEDAANHWKIRKYEILYYYLLTNTMKSPSVR